MKTLTKVLVIAVFGASLLHAAAFEKVLNSPIKKVVLSSEKPIALGSNTIKIIVTDEKYKDAKVSIKIFMPAMPGMPAMSDVVKAENTGEGTYESQVNFSMRGTWQVQIFITPKEGKKIRVKTSLNI